MTPKVGIDKVHSSSSLLILCHFKTLRLSAGSRSRTSPTSRPTPPPSPASPQPASLASVGFESSSNQIFLVCRLPKIICSESKNIFLSMLKIFVQASRAATCPSWRRSRASRAVTRPRCPPRPPSRRSSSRTCCAPTSGEVRHKYFY